MPEQYDLTIIDPIHLAFVEAEAERTGFSSVEIIEFAISALAHLRRSTASGAVVVAGEAGSDGRSLHFRTRGVTADEALTKLDPVGPVSLMRTPAEWRRDGVRRLRPRAEEPPDAEGSK